MKGFDLNSIYLYEWGELNYIKQDIRVGLYAIQDLIDNQEETYKNKKDEFIEKRKQELAALEEELKGSYDRHFFEEIDMGFKELKEIQRNATCLVFFSFFEGKLLNLAKITEEKVGVDIELSKRGIIKSIHRYFTRTIGVDTSEIDKFYSKIACQIHVRNAIAHTQSNLEDVKRFCKIEGIRLEGTRIRIVDSKYLKILIELGINYFEELTVAIDKKIVSLMLDKDV